MSSTSESLRLRDAAATERGSEARPHFYRPSALAPVSDSQPWRTVIHRTIADVPEYAWDALVGSGAVMRTHAYLSAIEAAAVADCRYFYPVVYDAAGEIVAHACVYTVATDLAQLLPRACHRVINGIRRLFPNFLCFRITECGAPMVAAHALSLRAGEPQAALLNTLESAVEAIAREARSVLVVFRDFTDPERERFGALRALGYNAVGNLPLARVRVRWNSYEAYLANMRSRYRKDVRRRLDRARLDGQTVRVLSSFGKDAQTWSAQARTIYENSKGFKREIPTPEYYLHMDRALDARSLLLVVEKQGRQIAHGMLLLDGENAVTTYFGREPGPPNAEWFHLLNEAIRIGIERQCRYVHLGRGSYDAKSLAGADVEALHVYCKCRYPLVNYLMRFAPDVMQEALHAPRRIFRDD